MQKRDLVPQNVMDTFFVCKIALNGWYNQKICFACSTEQKKGSGPTRAQLIHTQTQTTVQIYIFAQMMNVCIRTDSTKHFY